MQFVHWPTFLHGIGEMGTYVYAVVPKAEEDLKTFALQHTKCLIEIDPSAGTLRDFDGRRIWPLERMWFPTQSISIELIACICLGHYSGAWWDIKANRTWICDESQLTPEGLQIINALKLIGPVSLLTLTDQASYERRPR